MSHYSYRNKRVLKLTDGKLLFLCEYSDSRMTDWNGKRIWNWCVFHRGKDGLLLSTEEMKEIAHEKYDRQVKLLTEYRKKYESATFKAVDVNSRNYYGTIYNGSAKLKSMRAFYTIRKTIPFQEFIENNRFSIKLEIVDSNYKTICENTVFLKSEDDLKRVNEIYNQMENEYRKTVWVTVRGL